MSLPDLEKIPNKVGTSPIVHPPRLTPVNKPVGTPKKGFIKSKWTKNTPNDPNASAEFKLGPLEEFTDPKSRVTAVGQSDTDKGLKLIFDWTKDRQLQFNEFEDLLAEVFHKVYKNIK